MTTTVVSWNIAKRWEPWRQLAAMDADVALLQEANVDQVPTEVAENVDTRMASGRATTAVYGSRSAAMRRQRARNESEA